VNFICWQGGWRLDILGFRITSEFGRPALLIRDYREVTLYRRLFPRGGGKDERNNDSQVRNL
jgi:hypothetical protein